MSYLDMLPDEMIGEIIIFAVNDNYNIIIPMAKILPFNKVLTNYLNICKLIIDLYPRLCIDLYNASMFTNPTNLLRLIGIYNRFSYKLILHSYEAIGNIEYIPPKYIDKSLIPEGDNTGNYSHQILMTKRTAYLYLRYPSYKNKVEISILEAINILIYNNFMGVI